MPKISIFKTDFPTIPEISGMELFTAHTGMRYKKDDLLFAKFPNKASVGGIFTRNSIPGEPVNWCKKIIKKGIAAGLVVNSGYSNVFCGKAGVETVKRTVTQAKKMLKCSESEVYVSSTGIIGQPVKDAMLVEALDKKLKTANFEQACVAINTTDTFNKGAYIETTIDGKKVKLAGIIKGAGMVAPDMATMLGFIFTDADVPAKVIQQLLNEVKDKTYNAITVDSDTSTSDMILAFATAAVKHKQVKNINDKHFAAFRKAFLQLNIELARLVIKDGEGISKFVTVNINGAKSDKSALTVAKSIANSPLVKTAIAGQDANWGRIIAAIGKSAEPVNVKKLNIFLGKLQPAKNGGLNTKYDEKAASEYMKNNEIDIRVDLGVGKGASTVYTVDLTHEYISINADYRS